MNKYSVDLYINGQLMDQPKNGLTVRINDELWNPTKNVTITATYSYSFTLPATANNNKALGFANVLSVHAKFKQRYSAQLYADGLLLFDGSLTISSFDAEKQEYKCNLVNIKQKTIPDLFSDETLNQIKWEVPFNGAPTINGVNADKTTKYYFPLVAYGVFQKSPYFSDSVANDYTRKYLIDKYNKFWIESFYPSLNALEVVKKAFENKGYTVGGSAFSDPVLNNIYLSTNLADEQIPTYNLGNPLFGKLDITTTFNTWTTTRSSVNMQDLTFPYHGIYEHWYSLTTLPPDEYNFKTIDWFNAWSIGANTFHDKSYWMDPSEMIAVVPADGWYKVTISGSAEIVNPETTFTADQKVVIFGPMSNDRFETSALTLSKNAYYTAPFEIQLIRNYDGNIELIKGRDNLQFIDGNPTNANYTYWELNSAAPTTGSAYNVRNFTTCYPHEKLGPSTGTPTDTSQGAGMVAQSVADATVTTGSSRGGTHSTMKDDMYYYLLGNPMAYDLGVSSAFIIGASSMSGGVAAVQKNGKSWSRLSDAKGKCLTKVDGYVVTNGTDSQSPSKHNENTWTNAPKSNAYVSGNRLYFNLNELVYLNKNDLLELALIQKSYDPSVTKYGWSGSVRTTITAMSPLKEEADVRAENINYNSQTQFPTLLNLGEFMNKEVKISEFIDNIAKALNLTINKNGETIDIETNNQYSSSVDYAIDLDEKVGSLKYTSETIDFPATMSVQWKINTAEAGFEQSVPSDKINLEDWEKYGDSGYTVIKLNDDEYVTEDEVTQTNFSYTWYSMYTLQKLNAAGTNLNDDRLLLLPIIEKAEYMADGYGYDEAMKHDGYSLTQRFWYRGNRLPAYVWLADYNHEQVYVTECLQQYSGITLSYKDDGDTLLTKYFRATPDLSKSYVTIETYLAPEEYERLKQGAMLKYDDSLYTACKLNGFDPSGINKTKITIA